MSARDGLLVVDKPAGWTSHDVVGRGRRLARTKKVGHAGTLDPMATGVLLLGIGRATRLLGHLALTDKAYDASLLLGVSTLTDDAEGEVTATADPAGVTDEQVAAALNDLIGAIAQVPSAVSAIRVDGVRSYTRVRAGEPVDLPARPVVVSALTVLARRGPALDLRCTVSSGTYVRALARDLGAALGVGAHLTALRRTRVGPFGLTAAHTLEQLAVEGATDAAVLPLDQAVASSFSRRELTPDEAVALSHGRRLAPSGRPGPVGAFGPDGRCVALVEDRDGAARPTVVFAPG